MNDNETSIRIKRLRYRSWHRGCKETDLVLGEFCDAHITTLNEADLTAFEQLLEEDDAEIWDWLTGKAVPPKQDYEPLLEQLRNARSK